MLKSPYDETKHGRKNKRKTLNDQKSSAEKDEIGEEKGTAVYKSKLIIAWRLNYPSIYDIYIQKHEKKQGNGEGKKQERKAK